MTDFVVTLPLRVGEEARLFGAYLNRFMESRLDEANRVAGLADAPFVMVRTDPALEGELKTVIFQHKRTAAAFSTGWARACRTVGLRERTSR